jgi:hypothetical protein
METLAGKLFIEKRTEINFRNLADEVQQAFSRKILSRMDIEYFDALVRTSGFLYRDAVGNFSFMHRSFLEYFFAKTLQKRIKAGDLLIVEDQGDSAIGSFNLDFAFDLEPTGRWRKEAEERSNRAIEAVKTRLQTDFDSAYPISEGIVELLGSALVRQSSDAQITELINRFLRKREAFREDERALAKAASRMRGESGGGQEDIPGLGKAMERVTMIGGGGRVYYTVENYSFALFLKKTQLKSRWALVLGYSESWRHT